MSRKRLKSLKPFTAGFTCTSCTNDSRAFISTRMYLICTNDSRAFISTRMYLICTNDSRAFISTRMYLICRGYVFFCTKILSLFQEKILEIMIYD